MNAGWMIPFILLGGALQNCGAAMNGEFNKHATNPWLASTISFALNTFFFAGASVIHPHLLPTQKDFEKLPWWALVGGLVGAVHEPTASIDLLTSWFVPGGPPHHRDPIIATRFQDVSWNGRLILEGGESNAIDAHASATASYHAKFAFHGNFVLQKITSMNCRFPKFGLVAAA